MRLSRRVRVEDVSSEDMFTVGVSLLAPDAMRILFKDMTVSALTRLIPLFDVYHSSIIHFLRIYSIITEGPYSPLFGFEFQAAGRSTAEKYIYAFI
jgi:hypothetical protein